VLIYFIVVMLIPAGLEIAQKYKKPIIITSILLFGLMHIFNYVPLQWQLIWIYPLYVLPQLGMGIALTYVRFKNGFIWGIALHCLINSVSMGLSSVATKAAKQLQQQQSVGEKATKQAGYTLPTKTSVYR
jgi:membrane protease YdiL (CAAX protease family)